jgi:hypothetical protein
MRKNLLVKSVQKNIVLSGRDFDYFEDIKRFGFTTTEHYYTRFDTNFNVAKNRIHKLKHNNFLKAIGKSRWSNRKFYVPDHNFFRLCPTKNICRMNIFSAEHDEYLLVLYSLIVSRKLGEKIVLEQDIKKGNLQHKNHRIPDIIVENDSKKIIIEYEKTLKNKTKYEEMYMALTRYSGEKSRFVFICDTQKIALEIIKIMEIENVFVVKPDAFLNVLKEKKHEKFCDFLKYEELFYFKNGGINDAN